MHARLSVIKKSDSSEDLLFEYLHNHNFAIFFRSAFPSTKATISLDKKDLAQFPLFWGHLCKLADHLKMIPVNFTSEDGPSPQTSFLVTRFEEKVTIDFFSISKGNPPIMFWAIMICAKAGDPRNAALLPKNINAGQFHDELCTILRNIVSLGHKIEIET
jgi:hypothetical protein